MAKLIEKLLMFLPGIFGIAMVVMASITYVYIDKSPKPADDEDYENAKKASMINLVLTSFVFLLIALAYIRTLKLAPQANYITYF